MINFNSDRNSSTNDSDKRSFIKLDNEGDNYIEKEHFNLM